MNLKIRREKKKKMKWEFYNMPKKKNAKSKLSHQNIKTQGRIDILQGSGTQIYWVRVLLLSAFLMGKK